jgi:hypothetical protein
MAEKARTYPQTQVAFIDDVVFRKEFQARRLFDILSPALKFDAMYPKVRTPSHSVTLQKRSYSSGTRYSDSSDPRKLYAPFFEHGSEIPKVTISGYEYEAHALPLRTLAFDIPLNVREELQGLDQVRDTRNRVAFWLAEQVNAGVVSDVLNDWSITNTDDTAMEDILSHSDDFGIETTVGHLAGTLSSAYYWDEGGADPVTDILDLSTVFNNQSGYPWTATDVTMKNTELNLFNKFVISHGGTWAKDPTGSGWVTNAVGGITFHSQKNDTAGFDSTVGDGYIWMWDRNNPSSTTYYYTDSSFPTVGKFMNFHSWFDDKTKAWTFQFWHRRGTLVREPLAQAVLKVRD